MIQVRDTCGWCDALDTVQPCRGCRRSLCSWCREGCEDEHRADANGLEPGSFYIPGVGNVPGSDL